MIQDKIVQDPATGLIRALVTLGNGAAIFEEHRGTSWASATFKGMRHAITLSFSGGDAMAIGERLADMLPEHEFQIAGHIVADLAIVDIYRRREGAPHMTLKIEALTVEDS